MKESISVVCTYPSGGASIAKNRLIKALNLQKRYIIHDVTRFKKQDGKIFDNFANEQNFKDEDFIISKYQRYLIATNRTNITNTLFTGESSGWDLTTLQPLYDSSLINLHWVSEFINVESLKILSDLGKPIVWTLHDERVFTGGCHYTFGCMKYMESCASCPQVDEDLSWLPEFNLKSRSTLWNLPLTFICPSQWIEEKLIKSRVFNYENHQSHVISNSIDLNTFRPIDGISINSLKMELDIEQDSICLLAGSFSLDENRKGGKLIVDALKSLASLLEKQNISRKVVLLTYGEGSISIESLETKNLGFIKSEKQITLFLNVADLFLSMSREDNLPNTIMESLACGTPVISTNVGGISDMVVDNYNGRLIKRDNTRQMADTILHAVKNPKLVAEWSTNARKLAESNFSHQKQGLGYVKVFEHLLKESSLKSPAKKLSAKQTINNTVSRIPALNAFPSKSFREEALSWFEKQSSDEG